MILPCFEWAVLRVTVTTAVFCILLEVTMPIRVFGRPRVLEGALCWFGSLMKISLLRLLGGGLGLLFGHLLGQDRQDPRQIAPVLSPLTRVVEGAGSHLEQILEKGLAKLVRPPLQLFHRQLSKSLCSS